MGRPRTGVDINVEKAMTRVICQEVFLASGLTMAELETVFGMGTVDSFSKKTSKTFSRYCESDPAKSRAAPRDVLQRVVKLSLERGWFNPHLVNSLELNELLMLNHQRVSEIFEERKNERDTLVRSLRDLKAAVHRTLELNTKWKFVRAAKHHDSENDDIWQTHLKMRHAAELENGVLSPDSEAASLPDIIAPTSLNGCLELLAACLEQTHISFAAGKNVVPQPDTQKLANVPKPGCSTVDLSDIEALLAEVENSLKATSGAILVQ